jgi:hypothetical protein
MLRAGLHFDQRQRTAIRQDMANRFASLEKEKGHNPTDEKQKEYMPSFHGPKAESIGITTQRQRRARENALPSS